MYADDDHHEDDKKHKHYYSKDLRYLDLTHHKKTDKRSFKRV